MFFVFFMRVLAEEGGVVGRERAGGEVKLVRPHPHLHWLVLVRRHAVKGFSLQTLFSNYNVLTAFRSF